MLKFNLVLIEGRTRVKEEKWFLGKKVSQDPEQKGLGIALTPIVYPKNYLRDYLRGLKIRGNSILVF